ncbi:hypothetical protein EC9_47330 [Rosistilla ulvae]|uniref:Putative glutamine amidotransferase domain-containing protein n=1 Tax=Rosistilla ulvae TaxID=1930277 RepID=A0A517M6L6_9BACT|nr:glutamine amidotransferase [Rosistilla ulvae]QDS90519.1 hypothetical protein EC9_47330 [Rosistilla ulvae]
MSSWTTQPIFDSLGLIGLVAILFVLTTLLVVPQSTQLTQRRRRTLIGLRLVAATVLILALLRPTHVVTLQQPAAATLAILLDGSRSMTLPAGGTKSRWQSQNEVWQRIAPMLDSSDPTLKTAVYEYSGDLSPLDPATGAVEAFLKSQPEGKQTDLAAALRDTITRAAGSPLAGIVLIGDGTQTADIDIGPQAVAQTLASLEVPLWTVPIGPSQDTSAARDVAIDGMPDQFSVFAKNLFQVTATLSAQGLDNRSIPLRLMLTNAQGETEEIAQREIVAQGGDDDQRIAIELPAPAPGNYRLDLIAEPQDGEILTDNNRQTAFLDVRDGGGRVLYLEGQPRPEQLFLRRSIAASADFELTFEWIERIGQGKNWPVDLGTAFDPDRYDIYILGDLDSQALGEKQLQSLRQRIDEGAGLLTLGGFHSFDAGGYGSSPLADVLPVKTSPDRRQAFGQPPDRKLQIEGSVPIQITRPHPINQLVSGGPQQAAWDRLRPLKGANRLLGPKPIPGVEVLLESPSEEPLLVIGDFGNGRCAAFAGDSTWQWWRQGQREAHQRFWRQVLLWLMRRELASPDQIVLQMGRRRFAADIEVQFQASIGGEADDSPERKLTVQVIDADDKAIDVPATRSDAEPGAATVWTGKLPELADGMYRLRAVDTTAGSKIEPKELAFQVASIDRELSRPVADIAQMQQLAQVTSEIGGRSIPPDQIESLRELIAQNRQRSVSPVVQQWRLGDEPISGWLTMLVFGGLLTSDWVLRKRWGMV